MSTNDDASDKLQRHERPEHKSEKSEKTINEATENMDEHNKSIRAELKAKKELLYTTARRNFGAPMIVDEKGSTIVEGRRRIGENEDDARNPAKIFKAILDEIHKSVTETQGLQLTPEQQQKLDELIKAAPKDGGLRLTPEQLRQMDELWRQSEKDGGFQLAPEQRNKLAELFKTLPTETLILTVEEALKLRQILGVEFPKAIDDLIADPTKRPSIDDLIADPTTLPKDLIAQQKPQSIDDLLNPQELNDMLDREPQRIDDLVDRKFGSRAQPIDDLIDRPGSPAQIDDLIDRPTTKYEIEDPIDRRPTPRTIEEFLEQSLSGVKPEGLADVQQRVDRFFGIVPDSQTTVQEYTDLLQRELPEAFEQAYQRLSRDGGLTIDLPTLRSTIDKFNPFDPDGDGIITMNELRSFTANLDESTRKAFLDGFSDREIGAITLLDRYLQQNPTAQITTPEGMLVMPKDKLDELTTNMRRTAQAGIELLSATPPDAVLMSAASGPGKRVLTNEDFQNQPKQPEKSATAPTENTKPSEQTPKSTEPIEHDAKGRVSAVHYPDGHTLTFGYDSNGRLSRATDSRNGKVTKFDGFAVVDEQGRLTYYKGKDEHVREPDGSEIVRYGNGAKTIVSAKGKLIEATIPDADGRNTTYRREGKQWTVDSGSGPKPFNGDVALNPDNSITRVDYEAGKLTQRTPDGKEISQPFAREYNKETEQRTEEQKQVEISQRTRSVKELFEKLRETSNPADKAEIERSLRYRLKEMTKEQIEEIKSKGGFDLEKAIRENVSKLSYETRVELLVSMRGKEANHTVQGIEREIDRALAAPNKNMRLELLKEALADQSPEGKQAIASFIAKGGYSKLEQVFGKDSPQYPEALQSLDKAKLRTSSEAEKEKYTITKLFDELKEHPKDADTERRLRVYLSSLNSEQIKALKTEAGFDLEKELKANKSVLSESTYAATLDALRGSDRQLNPNDVERRAENALLVADSKQSLQMFEEALAGNAPEVVAARNQFMQTGGLEKLKQKFGADSAEFKEAKEFLENGQLKVSTRIERATGAWDAHDSVKLVISQLSPEERKQYMRGRELAAANQSNLGAEDQKALAFYKETHQALEGAASRFNKDGKPDRDLRGWEDIIVHGHETLLSKLTQHYANGDDGSIVADTIKTLSKEDYDRLTANGGNNAYAQQIKQELADLYNSSDILRPKDPASFDRVSRELAIIMNAGNFERARTLSGRPLAGAGDAPTIEEAVTKRKSQGGILDPAVRGLFGDANAQADQNLLNVYTGLRDANKLFEQLPEDKKREISGKLLEAYQVVGSNQEKAAELINQAVDQLMNALAVASIATGPEGPVAAGALRSALNFALRKAVFDLAPNLASPLVKAGTLGLEEYRKRPEFGAELAFAAIGTLAAATPEILHLYSNLKTLAKKGVKVEDAVLERAINDVRAGKDPAKTFEKAGIPQEDARELGKSLRDLEAKQTQAIEARNTSTLGEGRQTQPLGEGRQTQPIDSKQTTDLSNTRPMENGPREKSPEDYRTRPLDKRRRAEAETEGLPPTREVKPDAVPPTREIKPTEVPPTREVKAPKSEAPTAEQTPEAGGGNRGGGGSGGKNGDTQTQDLPPEDNRGRQTKQQSKETARQDDRQTGELDQSEYPRTKERAAPTQPLDMSSAPNRQEVGKLPSVQPGDKVTVNGAGDLSGDWEVKGFAKNSPEGGSFDVIVEQQSRAGNAVVGSRFADDAERKALESLAPGEKLGTADGGTLSPVLIDGQRYYRDQTGRVFQLSDVPNNKSLLIEVPQYRVVTKEQVAEIKPPDQSEIPTVRNLELPKTIESVPVQDIPNMRVEELGPAFRKVEVGGKEVTLIRFGGEKQLFFWGHMPTVKEAEVKVHIPTSDPKDLKKVQAVFIEALEKDPELAKRVIGWKTLDPAATVENPRGVTGKDQGAKAFTIYFANVEDALFVQKRLDEIANERGLNLKTPLETGNVDKVERSIGRPDVSSNRIGIVRDYYLPAKVGDKIVGAKLDPVLEDYINKSLSLPPGQQLTPKQLALVEEKAGLEPGTLSYSDDGHLMLKGGKESQYKGELNKYYLTEAYSGKDFGHLTDRPAYYSLAEKFLPPGYDPVDLSAGKVPPANKGGQ